MTKPDVFQGSVAVAETARDKASYSGFLAGLFETDVRWDLFTSIGIPQMSPAALDFLERFKIALIPLDPERVDSEGELPEPVLKTLAEIGAFGIKIPRGELVPETVLTDPNYVQNGRVTPSGMTELKKRMPYVDLTDFEKNPQVDQLPFTVDAVVSYVQSKLPA